MKNISKFQAFFFCLLFLLASSVTLSAQVGKTKYKAPTGSISKTKPTTAFGRSKKTNANKIPQLSNTKKKTGKAYWSSFGNSFRPERVTDDLTIHPDRLNFGPVKATLYPTQPVKLGASLRFYNFLEVPDNNGKALGNKNSQLEILVPRMRSGKSIFVKITVEATGHSSTIVSYIADAYAEQTVEKGTTKDIELIYTNDNPATVKASIMISMLPGGIDGAKQLNLSWPPPNPYNPFAGIGNEDSSSTADTDLPNPTPSHWIVKKVEVREVSF